MPATMFTAVAQQSLQPQVLHPREQHPLVHALLVQMT